LVRRRVVGEDARVCGALFEVSGGIEADSPASFLGEPVSRLGRFVNTGSSSSGLFLRMSTTQMVETFIIDCFASNKGVLCKLLEQLLGFSWAALLGEIHEGRETALAT